MALTSTAARTHVLTLCVVGAWDPQRGNPESWRLVYGHLQQLAGQIPTHLKRHQYLTNTPISLGKSRFRLAATQSTLTEAEAQSLLAGLPNLQDPAGPRPTTIDAPGAWDCRELLPADRDAPVHAVLPGLAKTRCAWVREWAPAVDALLHFLGDDRELLHQASDAVRAVLAIDLMANPDYLGALVTSTPVTDCEIEWKQQAASSWAFRTVGPLFAHSRARLTLTGFNDDRVVAAITLQLGIGTFIGKFPAGTERIEAVVHELTSGDLRYWSKPLFLNQIQLSMGITDQQVDLTFNLPGVTRPIEIRSEHGTRQDIVVGGRVTSDPALERRRRGRLARRLIEMTARRELVLLGPSDGNFNEKFRQQRELEIQALFKNHVREYVKIWDPYFGVSEVLRYLLAVYDVGIPMKVMTGERIRPPRLTFIQKVAARARWLWRRDAGGAQPLVLNQESINRVFSQIRTVKPGLRLPSTNLEVRAATSTRHHDRFLITADRCWLFGTSLNSVGENYSTMVELPNKEEIEALFDLEWSRAKVPEEGA